MSAPILPKRLFIVVRYGISIALIALLVNGIELGDSIDTLRSVRIDLLFYPVLFVIVHRVTTIQRWWLLTSAKGAQVSFAEIAWIWLVNNFVGLFLPATVGEDLAKSAALGRRISNFSDAASSVAVDRIIGLLAILLMALGSVIYLSSAVLPERVVETITLVTALMLLAIPILISMVSSATLKSFGNRLLNKLGNRRIQKLLTNLHNSFFQYSRHKLTLVIVFLIAILSQCARVLTVYFVAVALGLDVTVYDCFLMVPLISIITLLPISVGGFGVREGAFVYFFSFVGLSAASGLALSLANYGLLLIASIPGGVLYALIGLPARKPETV